MKKRIVTGTAPANVTVVPVRGKFIPGVPAVEQEVTPAKAQTLLASGAFVIKAPEKADKE